MKTNIYSFFERYWVPIVILIILLIPPLLNWLLPKWNYSNIGGDNSVVVWLNFLASYINSLIFCAVTIIVLYKQIKSNHIQNEENREANKSENELNRKSNEIQNEQNRDLTLRTLKYESRLSAFATLRPVLSDYISLFDLDEISIMKRRWQHHKKSGSEICEYIKERIEKTKKVWYSLSLELTALPECDSYYSNQTEHYKRLLELYSTFICFFRLDVSDYNSQEGRAKIRQSLNEKSYLYPFFKEQNHPFNDIMIEFSDICIHNIYYETQYFYKEYKTKIEQIIYG